MKTALITGITGQDGSYLAEFLLEKGYDVHGTIRRSSVDFRERIAHLEGTPHFHLHYADLGDSMSVLGVIGKVKPDEIYNLAAQSHVQVSFSQLTRTSAYQPDTHRNTRNPFSLLSDIHQTSGFRGLFRHVLYKGSHFYPMGQQV